MRVSRKNSLPPKGISELSRLTRAHDWVVRATRFPPGKVQVLPVTSAILRADAHVLRSTCNGLTLPTLEGRPGDQSLARNEVGALGLKARSIPAMRLGGEAAARRRAVAAGLGAGITREGKMTTSRYIARLMGPVFLTIGIGMVMGMLTEGEGYSSLLKEFISSRALIFVTGVLAFTAGLAVVNAHNLWVPDWRVIVTVLGWLMILRGFMNLVFPATVQTLGDRMIASHAGVLAGAAMTVVLGAILCIMGYEDLWREEAAREASAKPSLSPAKRPRRK